MYSREAIMTYLRHYPRLVQGGRMPGREDVLSQRQKRDCAPWEGTAAIVADLELALSSLPPWKVCVTLTWALHGYRGFMRERIGKDWELSPSEVGKVTNGVIDALYESLNGLNVTSVGLVH